MRAFIAVQLPKEIRDELFELQKQIKGIKAKWVAKKNLHLTLKFLGEINEGQLSSIQEKLNIIKFAPIQTALEKVGTFPDINKPRVIWIGLKNEKEIISLQQKIDAELLSICKTEADFRAHITLGRIKFVKSKELFKDSLKSLKENPLQFTISSFDLMESMLSREGPEYKTVKEYSVN
ncbi:RNA 2',3'-cyclic phosphodiesterase [archaeon]|nr:RNA 2',3'-cyclic phosphodiesterase [archaeon]